MNPNEIINGIVDRMTPAFRAAFPVSYGIDIDIPVAVCLKKFIRSKGEKVEFKPYPWLPDFKLVCLFAEVTKLFVYYRDDVRCFDISEIIFKSKF